MYVCICNAIKEEDVRTSAQNGAQKAREVFNAHGCKPECAKCTNCIRTIIKNHHCANQSCTTSLAAE